MILTTDFRDKLCNILDDSGILYHSSNIIFKKISLEEYNRTKAKLELFGKCLEISTNLNILNIDYSSETVKNYLSSKYNLEVITTPYNTLEIKGGASKDHFTDSCLISIEPNDEDGADVYVYDIAFIVHDYMKFEIIKPNRFKMIPINTYDLSKVDFDETIEVSQTLRGVRCIELLLPNDIFGSIKQKRSLLLPFKGLTTRTLDLTKTSFEYTRSAKGLFAGISVKELKLGTLDLSHLRNSLGNFGKMFNSCDIDDIIIDKILVADEYMKADLSASITSSSNENISAINGEYDTLVNNCNKLRNMIEVVKR